MQMLIRKLKLNSSVFFLLMYFSVHTCCVISSCNNSPSLTRFLADLMDGPELIRNVTLCGHLHHGKVRVCPMSASGSLALVALCL